MSERYFSRGFHGCRRVAQVKGRYFLDMRGVRVLQVSNEP